MRRGLWVLIPGLLMASAACGKGGGGTAPPGPVERPVEVRVNNSYALPVDIYAVGSGITQRLGTVHPGMNGNFTIPPVMVGNGVVEFQARTDTQTYRSGPIMLSPGKLVAFSVASQLFNSTVSLGP